MDATLSTALNRADELFEELKAAYSASLEAHAVDPRMQQLTHDLLEKVRTALDRAANRYHAKYIAPYIDRKKRALVYFPIASDEETYNSIMGGWRWNDVKADHVELDRFFRDLQPFTSPDNGWLGHLASLANLGKHIDVAPQRRIETKRISVASPTGVAVSWNPSSVRFGAGVRIAGVPVDVATQRIVPTPHLTETIEVWTAILLADTGEDVLRFADRCRKVGRAIVTAMDKKFDLSAG